jgi:hypothetical protein
MVKEGKGCNASMKQLGICYEKESVSQAAIQVALGRGLGHRGSPFGYAISRAIDSAVVV